MIKNLKHRISQFFFFLYFLLHCLIYLLSLIFPRNKKVFVYGAFIGESFCDNGKYLFLIANDNHPDITHVWISKNKKDIKHIRTIGFKAFHKFSFQGIYYSFIAKNHYYTHSTWDTCFFITHGSLRINLWHGIPIKKIGADYCPPRREYLFRQAIHNSPYIFNAKEVFIAPSEFIAPLFKSAFRMSLKYTMIAPYARLLLFLMNKGEQNDWIQKYENDYVKGILNKTKHYSTVWTYMPTWRDSNRSFMNEAVHDWEQLDAVASNNNALLIIKVHFLTVMPANLASLTNIIFFESKADFYPILAISDLLITDYSSVFFDYLLTKKPIIFYAFDLDDYKKHSRAMYFEYEQIAYGNIIYSFNELIRHLSDPNDTAITFQENKIREKLLSKMWGVECIDSNQDLFYSNLQNILQISVRE